MRPLRSLTHKSPFWRTYESNDSQITLDGEPAEMMEIITAYGAWLSRSSIPKLFIQGEPGTMPQSERAFCRAFPAQRAVTVQGLHFLQEDAPDEVGVALASWLPALA